MPAELDSKNVSRQDIGPLKSIRLRHFTRGTTNEVRSLLTHWDAPALVIDIRGNSGGDLNVAIDTAMLFLKKDQPIVSVQRSRDTTHYRSLNERPPPTIPIYVWQDQTTASAAEVFVAALTDNKVATSIGTRTFGKGTQLELLELTDGSAIALTSGYLLTPAGTAFNNVGLKPNYALTDPSSTTDQYITTTLRLLGLPSATDLNDVRDQNTP